MSRRDMAELDELGAKTGRQTSRRDRLEDWRATVTIALDALEALATGAKGPDPATFAHIEACAEHVESTVRSRGQGEWPPSYDAGSAAAAFRTLAGALRSSPTAPRAVAAIADAARAVLSALGFPLDGSSHRKHRSEGTAPDPDPGS